MSIHTPQLDLAKNAAYDLLAVRCRRVRVCVCVCMTLKQAPRSPFVFASKSRDMHMPPTSV